MPGSESLAERVRAVRARIEEAAGRVDRDPATVEIVAVTKTFPPEAIAAALDVGCRHVGENYVQEARDKRALAAEGAVWHLIGGLQTNKARVAVETFDWIHTVDSPRLAQAIDTEAARAGRRVPVLLQVNVAGEAQKRGTTPEDLVTLARAVLGLPALTLSGLMTIPPEADDPEDARPHFRRLRELRDRVQDGLGVELPHLSMGMSDDFVIAVEEGATMVRLGRALFGPRGPRSWREGS